MTVVASGRLSDLVLVRLHRRSAEYAVATDSSRPGVAAACRRDATVDDLAERILHRTIYAQASSRLGPLRELVQNAIDASPRGGRVDVRSDALVGGQAELTVSDRGKGMSRAELMEDLLVPFRSGKQDDPETIGEHGIGFLSALEIAPRLEVVTATATASHRLSVEPLGAGPPYPDFAFTLESIDDGEPARAPYTRRAGSGLPGRPHGEPSQPPFEARRRQASGTSVRLFLERPLSATALAQEVSAVAGLVDPALARIFVDGEPINTQRARLRRVARVPIGEGGVFGELELLAGRSDGMAPRFIVSHKGLLVIPHLEPFGSPELSLHCDLLRAVTSAGYTLVADLPLGVPLTKGRSAVAAMAAPAVAAAIIAAFERFVLEDALYDRELLRGVDHRLAAVLDRLVGTALRGEPAPAPATTELGGVVEVEAERAPNVPTVAAPEGVVRFAGVLVDAPMFVVAFLEAGRGEVRCARSLRDIVDAHRRGVLRAQGCERELRAGIVYLVASDPLGQALFRRLTLPPAPPAAPDPSRPVAAPMPRVNRERLLAAGELHGVRALAAALAILERIDGAISLAAGLPPSSMSAHQDLYGPDEMAHTDGLGISVNLASPRIRALLAAVLASDDAAAFGALVDLTLHEKAHVALASHVPRSCAEHGASFYRKKEQLRRRLIEAVGAGEVIDPIRAVAALRVGLGSIALPEVAALAAVFNPAPLAA